MTFIQPASASSQSPRMPARYSAGSHRRRTPNCRERGGMILALRQAALASVRAPFAMLSGSQASWCGIHVVEKFNRLLHREDVTAFVERSDFGSTAQFLGIRHLSHLKPPFGNRRSDVDSYTRTSRERCRLQRVKRFHHDLTISMLSIGRAIVDDADLVLMASTIISAMIVGKADTPPSGPLLRIGTENDASNHSTSGVGIFNFGSALHMHRRHPCFDSANMGISAHHVKLKNGNMCAFATEAAE